MSVPQPERPACLLCLVQTTASMAQPFVFQGKEMPKLRVACWCLDDLLESLAHWQGRGAKHLRRLEVGVLGVSAERGRPLRAVPLLTAAPADGVFQPLAALAKQSMEPHAHSTTRRWVSLERAQDAGTPDALPATA